MTYRRSQRGIARLTTIVIGVILAVGWDERGNEAGRLCAASGKRARAGLGRKELESASRLILGSPTYRVATRLSLRRFAAGNRRAATTATVLA